MECISVERLNEAAKNPSAFMAEGERIYADRLEEAARAIYESREERPVVLISGPSGSGKTTSAIRISELLKERGCGSHVISMDNYFLPKDADIEREPDGSIDYESPKRIDIKLFREHLEKLFLGKEIEVPTFDFATQDRGKGFALKREKGDLVIIEGIHALNPLLTGDSEAYTTCIYVSVRTRIELGGELLHPSKIRLMRRLIRDKLYRGRGPAETFDFFKSVERGENLYIMPYKHRADFDIDTFIEFGPSVYRDILLPDLDETEKTYENYAEFADMAKFLRALSPVQRDIVPQHSLIREFIG